MMTWNGGFFQNPSTFLMETVLILHDYIMMFLFSVLLFVSVSIIFSLVCSSFSLNFFENHNLEIIWTILPFLILAFLLVPSLKNLYMMDSCNFCGFSLRVIGYQWYWKYKFFSPLSGDLIKAKSYIIFKGSSLRLLEVDHNLVLPSNMPIRALITSMDVIHSWTVPSFGIKMDAVPGRINQVCFNIKQCGLYFGQCSEICGAFHSFMPISVEVVPALDFFEMYA